MSNLPSETSTPPILPLHTIETSFETQPQEIKFNSMSNWPRGTSTTSILPPDMIETQHLERQILLSLTTLDISRHIRQQNADNKRVGLDLGKSSGVKTRTKSKVWENFVKYKDENEKDRARCKVCGKDFNGSSKSGTSHLRNHFKSCQRKRKEGGGGDNSAGNLSDTIVIKKKSMMDRQLNHLDAARMIIQRCDASLINSTNMGYIIDVYEEEKEKLRNYFEKPSCRMCLTFSDIKTKLAHCTCWKVCFIDDDCKLKNKIIGFKYFNDVENVMKDTKNLLLEWGIESNLSSMVIGGDSDRDFYEMMSCFIERGDCFSNQRLLLFNNNLIYECVERGSDEYDFLDDYCFGYTTANTHFPLLCRIYECFKGLRKREINSFCDEFIERADNAWCECNLVLAIASVLDPRFKMDIVKNWYKKIFGDEWETKFTKFTVYFTNIYNEYARDINNFKSFTSGLEKSNSSTSYKMLDPLGKLCESSPEPNHVRLLNSELHLYLEEVKFPSFEDFDILEWWRVHARYFPTLARMARDFLSIQISSDPFIVSYDDMKQIKKLGITEAYTCTQSWLVHDEVDPDDITYIVRDTSND